MSLSLDEELDRIYQRPLDEFVEARNALAKSLRQAGDAEASKRVKALAKPSASAWAVNQLYFGSRDVFDRLIESGDACRRAQRELLEGGDPGSLARAEASRREAVAEACRLAERLLVEAGVSSGPAVRRRVATTLEALATYGSANPSPWSGRSSEDLEPPGFRALSGLAVSSPAPRPAPSEAQAALPDLQAEARSRDAEAMLRQAEEALASSEAFLERTERRAQRLSREVEAIRERLARAESELHAAESERARARNVVEEEQDRVERARKKFGGDGAS